MGVGGSRFLFPSVCDDVLHPTTTRIERELLAERQRSASVVKLLLVGSCERGKSVLLSWAKQWPSSEDGVARARHIMFNAVVQTARRVLEHVDPGVDVSEEELESAKTTLGGDVDLVQGLSAPVKTLLATLAQRSWFRAAFDQIDQEETASSPRPLSTLERVSSVDYYPSLDDLAWVQGSRLCVVVERCLVVRDVECRLIHWLGSSEGFHKCLHFFEAVSALIYVVSLRPFLKDETGEALQAEVDCFHTMANTQWFHSLPILLLFTDADAFREEVSVTSLIAHFPSLSGGDDGDVVDSVTFVQHVFAAQDEMVDESRSVWTATMGLEADTDPSPLLDLLQRFIKEEKLQSTLVNSV